MKKIGALTDGSNTIYGLIYIGQDGIMKFSLQKILPFNKKNITQATPCGATHVASMRFTSKLSFYIRLTMKKMPNVSLWLL